MFKIATLVVLLGLTAQPALALNVGAGVDVSAQAGTGTGASTKVETNATASSTTNAQANTAATVEISTRPIVIKASDVDETQVSVSSAAEVDTSAELDSYARGVIKANADIRDISLTEEEVAVSHKQNARLFGILPITVYARAHVASDGSVEVKFPWYAFASAKKAAIESRVEAAVRTSLPSVSAEASAKLSAHTQAEVLAKTVAAMQAEMQADAEADAAAKIN
jgi:hypothetical protein